MVHLRKKETGLYQSPVTKDLLDNLALFGRQNPKDGHEVYFDLGLYENHKHLVKDLLIALYFSKELVELKLPLLDEYHDEDEWDWEKMLCFMNRGRPMKLKTGRP